MPTAYHQKSKQSKRASAKALKIKYLNPGAEKHKKGIARARLYRSKWR